MGKRILYVVLCAFLLIAGEGQTVFANEQNESNSSIEADMDYEDTIKQLKLSEKDERFLLENEQEKELIQQRLSEGLELKSVEIIDTQENNNGQRGYTSQGKVVCSSYVQPTTSKKYYNNKLYSSAQKCKSAIAVVLALPGGTKGQVVRWVASTLFSIDTSNYAVWFNNGYQKVEINATYYIKDAYYKEGNNYWIGYSAEKSAQSVSVFSYYRNKNNVPQQKTVSRNKSFYSPSYAKNDGDLVALAKKYYKTGFVQEYYVPTDINMN